MASVASDCARNLTLQDLAAWSMCAWLTLKTLAAGGLRPHDDALSAVLPLFTLSTLTIVAVRGEMLARGPARALLYRCGMFASLGGSYFVLRPVLHALRLHALDPQLLAIDEFLFGQTPAMYLDRFVTPASVEWFAFFYYGFYALIFVFVVGSLVLDSGRRRYELLLGMALVMSLGHMTYTLVPGAGPFTSSSLHFAHALRGGAWWMRVESAVQVAGAHFDIFPSLHTAVSLLIALHVLRHRREAPFHWAAPATCFVVANIIVATLFLRWHYGIDVIAGAALAVAAQRVAIHSWGVEGARTADRQPVWEPILPPNMAPADRRFILGFVLLQAAAVGLLLELA